MTSKITPLRRLVEGEAYVPGPDEYVVLPEHSIEDVLHYLLEEIGGDKEDLEYLLWSLWTPVKQ